jgi:hypothetical protein
MEEEHIVGAHGANNATKPNLKRKRRRSAIEVVDLTEGNSLRYHIYLQFLPFSTLL